jgi:hypothetical protein
VEKIMLRKITGIAMAMAMATAIMAVGTLVEATEGRSMPAPLTATAK